MAEYKLGKVYTCLDKEEAKEFVGKKGFFSDDYGVINNYEYLIRNRNPFILGSVDYTYDSLPFNIEDASSFQFFRPIIEEEPRRMTWAELIEWLACGNGMISFDCTRIRLCWTVSVSCYENEFNKEVGEKVRIRHFGTKEIIIPTREIFLKDCRGGKNEEK